MYLMESTREGRLEEGSVMKGTGLYLKKRRCELITSSFVVLKTNLFLSYCMTHAEGRMESNRSRELLLQAQQPEPPT